MQTKMSFKRFGQFRRHVNAVFQIDYRADIWRTSKIHTGGGKKTKNPKTKVFCSKARRCRPQSSPRAAPPHRGLHSCGSWRGKHLGAGRRSGVAAGCCRSPAAQPGPAWFPDTAYGIPPANLQNHQKIKTPQSGQ